MLKFLSLPVLALLLAGTSPSDNDLLRIGNGRSLLDAHNCYPYDGRWADRIDRALATGFPVGIEQDVAPYTDPATGSVIPKVTHNSTATAQDPALKQYFFEHVRPIVERELHDGDKKTWPNIVVHFDFKNNDPRLLEAVWNLLGEYEDWITTAPKTASDADLPPFDRKPLLVLTEENDAQEQVFYRRLAKGDKLRIFGSAPTNQAVFKGLNEQQKRFAAAHTAPSLLLTTSATNYRRWWNLPWAVVEEGGQHEASNWTPEDDRRLRALVDHAHRRNYAIRFYTLDGFAPADDKGWGSGYNFESPSAVRIRWQAAAASGVDLIATDQYEELRQFLNSVPAQR
jgi:hypothetical protein